MVSTMQEHDAATKLKSAIVTILYRASYSGWRREVLQLWRSWPFGGSPTRLQTLTDTDQSRDCPQPRASGGDCFYSGESGHMVCRIMPPTTDRRQAVARMPSTPSQRRWRRYLLQLWTGGASGELVL